MSIPFVDDLLTQEAVYWAPLKADTFGRPTWAAPVEIFCRWEAKQTEFFTPEGERKVSSAVVFVAVDVATGGVLFQGPLSSSVDENNPKANVGAVEIQAFTKIEDLDDLEFCRTAFC